MNADSCQQFCSQLSAVLLSAVSSSALNCQQFCSQLSAVLLSVVSSSALNCQRYCSLIFPQIHSQFSAWLPYVFRPSALSFHHLRF